MTTNAQEKALAAVDAAINLLMVSGRAGLLCANELNIARPTIAKLCSTQTAQAVAEIYTDRWYDSSPGSTGEREASNVRLLRDAVIPPIGTKLYTIPSVVEECLRKISAFCPPDPTVNQLDTSPEMLVRLHNSEIGDTARAGLAALSNSEVKS